MPGFTPIPGGRPQHKDGEAKARKLETAMGEAARQAQAEGIKDQAVIRERMLTARRKVLGQDE